MNVGIIGSTGFVGRHLISLLLRNPEINIIHWNRDLYGDFCKTTNQIDFIRKNRFDLIFQLSWNNIDNESYRSSAENDFFADATISFAKLCSISSIPIVVFGSSLADHTESFDNYSISKKKLQDYLRFNEWHNVYLVKPSYIFSVKDQRPHVLKKYLQSRFSTHNHNFSLNNPDSLLDFIHVSDLVLALSELKFDLLEYKEINIISGYLLSVTNFIECLNLKMSGNHFDTKFQLKRNPLSDEANTIISNSKTLRYLSCNFESND